MREDEHLAERNRTLFEMLDSELVKHLSGNQGSRSEETNQVEFLILNYSMASFKAKYGVGMNMQKVRVNFAPHAYMFKSC